MLLYNIPILIVLVFLGLTLVVGFYTSKKETTYREYAVGNKNFQTVTLVVTSLATFFGGASLMRNVPGVYSYGMLYIAFLFANAIHHLIIPSIGLRMGPFMEHLSVAETIGSVYGKYPRIIVAILGICASIGFISIQISTVSSAMGMCIDSIDPRIMTVLATLILIAYSMLGGVRSITITDILQFLTFIIIIALLVKFLFIKTGKSFLEVVWLLKKETGFQFSNLFQSNWKLFNLVQSYLWFAFGLHPLVIQKLYIASGPIQIYKVFSYVTPCSIIILLCLMLIGMLVFVMDPTLPETAVWPYILSHMSPIYTGCMVICLLGMAMSTADSGLHTTSIMVSHDIVESILGVKLRPYTHRLRLAKLTILVTGLLAMIETICYPFLFELISFVTRYAVPLFTITASPPFKPMFTIKNAQDIGEK